MKRFLPDRTTAVSFGAGLVLALSFPRANLAFLAWVALVPMILVMERRPFRSGFAAGVGFFALVLYWLNIVMTTYGHLPIFFSVVAYLLLVIYLALFFAAATWAACRLKEKSGLPVVLTLPVLWVALSFLRSFLLTGFPWATLGYSQGQHLPLVQSADLVGVYGITYLLVLVNAVLAALWSALRRPRGARHLPWRSVIAAALLFALNLGYGWYRLGQPLDARRTTVRAAMIQGDIDQSVKWNPAFQKKTIDIYRRLSLAAAAKGPLQLIVWPESATPFYFQDAGHLSAEVRTVPRQTGAELLFGSPAYKKVNGRYHYLNSAFLLSTRGEVLGRSDKVHLVPFGEYVPLSQYLPFIHKLVAGIGDFSPGTVSPLPMDGHRIGVLVCFEGIFPELAREEVRRGSDLLVNITNDAWFGRSSAPFQDLGMTRFRAIENRVWVLRAANTGVSAFIAPSGRIIRQTPIFAPRYLLGTCGLGAHPTLYTAYGDVGPVLCLLLGIWWLIGTRQRRAAS